MAVHFYDSASPENIPTGVHAAVYINGFAWPESEIRRMSRVIRVSVLREAHWAQHARVIDVENGAAQPQDVVPFIRYRMAMGAGDRHNATAYVNRSNYEQVRNLVKEAGLHCRYWVATLDGTQEVEGSWAVQYWGGVRSPYDLSVLHGVNDFSKAA